MRLKRLTFGEGRGKGAGEREGKGREGREGWETLVRDFLRLFLA